MSLLMQGSSLFKPTILAGITAIEPVFTSVYTDEYGQPFTVQVRGAFSTEKRFIPNIVVSVRVGATTMFPGQNILYFNDATQMYVYGVLVSDSRLLYTVQGRDEAEREWLIDTLATAFTGLVFTQPSTSVFANNNVVDYLCSQGIVVVGFEAPDYPHPNLSDDASPRPEGQVYEATFPVKVDLHISYEMPGFSASSAAWTSQPAIQTDYPIP